VLVARQLISQVPSHLVEIQVHRGLDDGVHALAEVVVGQPDDGAGGDAGMRLERRLDLGRVDVLATDQDHVGGPVGQEQVPVLIHPAHVAERLPPVALARLGADVPVRRRAPSGPCIHTSPTWPGATSSPSGPRMRIAP